MNNIKTDKIAAGYTESLGEEDNNLTCSTTFFFGIDDEEFIRGEVPMTKKEIRVLALAAAHLTEDSVVCDVGAGTGSISVEAALAARRGQVFAVEKNPAALDLIKANAEKFGANNVVIVPATAPYGLNDLPPLDVAFVGGSGGNLPIILEVLSRRLKAGGRIIVTAITPQTAATCMNDMKKRDNFAYEATLAQISRFRRAGSFDLPVAQNPVYIIVCEKE